MKRKVCLYSSFVAGNTIPYYVRYYLQQLLPFFDKIIYITNERNIDKDAADFLKQHDVELMQVANEGYDFGMWYKSILKLEEEHKCPIGVVYNTVALINDSCILFKGLETDFKRINQSSAKYSGMIISDRYATHIQSFFLVVRDEAIDVLSNYFHRNGIVLDYRQVIQIYEIGLTGEMLKNGIEVGALYNNANRSFSKNPSFALVKDLIEEGMPLIKKKIVFRNFRGLEYYWVVRMNFDTDYRKYFKLIRQKYGDHTIDLKRVMDDAPVKGHVDIILFALARSVANFLRLIPGVRPLFHWLVHLYKKYFRRK
jgi:lipopolysaccharide biosynthesis protein